MNRLAAILAAVWLQASILAGQPDLPLEASYDLGNLTFADMSRDLHAGLEASLKSRFTPHWLGLDFTVEPAVRFDGAAGVRLSTGFVEAIQRLAHAHALNRVERGYFQRYLKSLDRGGTGGSSVLPDRDRAEYWTLEVMNARMTAANAMLAVVASMHLCEISLGYFEKYRARLGSGEMAAVPSVTAFLTPEEWQEVVEAGVRVSLLAGWTFDAVAPLFEGFDRMKHRPSWTTAFLPPGARFSRVKKRLEEIQGEFLKD